MPAKDQARVFLAWRVVSGMGMSWEAGSGWVS